MNPENLDEILNQAIDLTNNSQSYATTARFAITPTELFLDLYVLAPNPSNLSTPEARRIQRIILPLSTAKDLAEKMLQGVKHWENVHGINLPLEAINTTKTEK